MASCEPDYWKIADLERELFGKTFPCQGSPLEAVKIAREQRAEEYKEELAKRGRDAWAQAEWLRENQTRWNPSA